MDPVGAVGGAYPVTKTASCRQNLFNPLNPKPQTPGRLGSNLIRPWTFTVWFTWAWRGPEGSHTTAGAGLGDGVILLMDKILHDPKDPKLWELWYIPYNGQCRILSINSKGMASPVLFS